MPLKKRNLILLVSLIILTLLVFSVVFLKPSYLNKLLSGKDTSYPTQAKKSGYVIAKNESSTFFLEVPEDWILHEYPVSEGYVSLLSLQSPDYKINSPEGMSSLNNTFESGASLDISVLKSFENFVGTPPFNISHQEEYKVGNINGNYYVYTDIALTGAEFHELRFAYNGNAYYIKMTFDPAKYPEGGNIFKYILSTLVLR